MAFFHPTKVPWRKKETEAGLKVYLYYLIGGGWFLCALSEVGKK